MASILTIDNQVMCPHGGQAILVTSNSAFLVEGSPALLETDLPTIAGCPFIIGLVYSPCVLIEWMTAAETLTVDGGGQLWGETWTTGKPEYFGGQEE